MGDERHAVAVTSFTADTIPATVLTQPIASQIDRRIPSARALTAIMTEAELVGFTPRQNQTQQVSVCHGVPIPPILAVALVRLHQKRLAKAFFAVQETLNALDTVLEDNGTQATP